MELIEQIKISKTVQSRIREVDWNNLEFGKYYSDHMLVCDYNNRQWQAPQILPFGNLSLSPAALALHYGQTIFEGMKAFRTANGQISIFRPYRHYERLKKSADRMCMPVVPVEVFIEGLKQLISLDQPWVPKEEGAALYLRPFIIATEVKLRVKVSEEFRFIIVTSPVSNIFQGPLRIKVETDFVRSVKGGTGFAKCGGNYGATLYPALKAQENGYDQVLWTDGKQNKYIEESGMMNVMFVINKVLVTPPLSDSILDGVTRDSLLALAGEAGIPSEERPITVKELTESFHNGSISEAFGVGTAAVAAPVKIIGIGGIDYELPVTGEGGLAFTLKERLESIRTGKEKDLFGWNFII